MLRILRAFAWMRWRVLINSLEHTGARDTLERFSLAIEQIGPLIALVFFVPSTLAAAGLGAAAGYALATGETQRLLFEIGRYLLLTALVLSAVAPIAMPASARTNTVRLLLLPIGRPTLYAGQLAGVLADPWLLISVPFVLLVPVGLAAGGAFASAALALAAGVLLVVTLVGVVGLVTSLLHILVRNQRRGEFVALLFIFLFPLIALWPALSSVDQKDRARTDGAVRRAPAWVTPIERAAPYVPTELYARVVREAAAGPPQEGLRPLAGLGALVAGLHALGFFVYGRVLDSPTGVGRRAARRHWSLRLRGMSAATSAVALAHLRLVMRTPRGRAILLSPLIIVAMFGVMLSRATGDLRVGFISLESGVGLATFGAAASLLAILPVAVNQFAVDGAGLTLVLLSPVSDRELLAGKAIGNGLTISCPLMLCLLASLVAFPGGSVWLWLSVPLAIAATYVLTSPATAALSAIFPRPVDMNSIGSGSNAHAAAGLLGMMAFAAAGVPCALLVLFATSILGQPALAPVFLLIWLSMCVALAAGLFVPVRKLFARRRENLAITV